MFPKKSHWSCYRLEDKRNIISIAPGFSYDTPFMYKTEIEQFLSESGEDV